MKLPVYFNELLLRTAVERISSLHIHIIICVIYILYSVLGSALAQVIMALLKKCSLWHVQPTFNNSSQQQILKVPHQNIRTPTSGSPELPVHAGSHCCHSSEWAKKHIHLAWHQQPSVLYFMSHPLLVPLFCILNISRLFRCLLTTLQQSCSTSSVPFHWPNHLTANNAASLVAVQLRFWTMGHMLCTLMACWSFSFLRVLALS